LQAHAAWPTKQPPAPTQTHMMQWHKSLKIHSKTYIPGNARANLLRTQARVTWRPAVTTAHTSTCALQACRGPGKLTAPPTHTQSCHLVQVSKAFFIHYFDDYK
jgi:hypothetical protein